MVMNAVRNQLTHPPQLAIMQEVQLAPVKGVVASPQPILPGATRMFRRGLLNALLIPKTKAFKHKITMVTAHTETHL